jgi:hypothetical protein
VLAPLVRPEVLIISVDINPVLVHVVDQVAEVLVLQDRCDVGVSALGVAACLVCAVAVVGPGWEGWGISMNLGIYKGLVQVGMVRTTVRGWSMNPWDQLMDRYPRIESGGGHRLGS